MLLKTAIDLVEKMQQQQMTLLDDIISKQAIMKDLHELNILNIFPKLKKKKQVKILYINADEDHVSLQFNKKMGCSAEGQVSHLLASRLSSRPLGWSKHGVSQMAKLRAYVANEGKVYDLIKYQKEKEKRVIQEKMIGEIDEQIKKKQKTYTEVWNHSTVAGSLGKVDGMYCLTKKLRGIS